MVKLKISNSVRHRVVKLKLSDSVRHRIAAGMLVFAGLMLIDSVYQLGMHVVWRRWIAHQAPAAAPATQPAAASVSKSGDSVVLAAAITRRNIFTAPRATGHGLALTGVIGNIALFAGRDGGTVGIKEGESARGVTVKSIDGFEVKIEYEGKPETMQLFRGGKEGMSPAGAGPPPGLDQSRIPPEIRERMERRMRERRR